MSEEIEDLEGLASYYVHGMGNAMAGIHTSIDRYRRLDLPEMAENARTNIERADDALESLPSGRNAAGDELVTITRAYLDVVQRYLNGEVEYEATKAVHRTLVDQMRDFRDAFTHLVEIRRERGEETEVPSLVHGTWTFR